MLQLFPEFMKSLFWGLGIPDFLDLRFWIRKVIDIVFNYQIDQYCFGLWLDECNDLACWIYRFGLLNALIRDCERMYSFVSVLEFINSLSSVLEVVINALISAFPFINSLMSGFEFMKWLAQDFEFMDAWKRAGQKGMLTRQNKVRVDKIIFLQTGSTFWPGGSSGSNIARVD